MPDPSSRSAFPAIGQHAAIGDRRTGALVAADGTLNWWCLPDFDGLPAFASLLDLEEGGFCRVAPVEAGVGRQSYVPDTNAAVTAWKWPDGRRLEVTDLMAWPEDDRPAGTEGQRLILRRLRVSGGDVPVEFSLCPRWNFAPPADPLRNTDEHWERWEFNGGMIMRWTSFPARTASGSTASTFTMTAGEEHWVAIGWQTWPFLWSRQKEADAREIFEAALVYWRGWSAGLELGCAGEYKVTAQRSALTVQLLTHAEHGTAVAALTTSLPERLGGDRNYDYRFAWVRDGSLALAYLARMGKAGEVRCYLDHLAKLPSRTPAPLQVVYGADGRTKLDERTIDNVSGYADSRPVRVGNRAAQQRQVGAAAFLADCIRLYLEHGGKLEPQHWALLERIAKFMCQHWRDKGSGIWELEEEAEYVDGKVGAWVVLERASWIAERTGYGDDKQLAVWRKEMDAIHAEVMDQGWCEEKGAFRQRYGHDALDASALLIPLLGFLPDDHPRVLSTLEALERELVVNGLIHRFDPAATLGGKQLPLGKFEGAFLPCVFWHAHLLARLGRLEEARALLRRCEKAAGLVGLFAEEMNAADDNFLGNTPLLFSHVEYVRAAIALHEADSKSVSPAKP